VRHGGEGLDVVDDRGVGGLAAGVASVAGCPAHLRPGREQAVQVGRVAARQRVLALDDLEERLLLTEQVGVGTQDEADRNVAREPHGTHLDQGPAKILDLACEAGLDGQEGVRGPHGQGGDGQPFDDLVGVVAQDGPVLEGAGLALGAVGHDEAAFVVAAGVEEREPLAPGAEPPAATAAQTRQGHFLGGSPGTDGPRQAEAFPAASEAVGRDRGDGISAEHDTSAGSYIQWGRHG
jgi:hypothetical protein